MAEGQINNSAYAGRPSVCRNCGALVGAGEASCSACGASVAGGVVGSPAGELPRRGHDAETMRFARAIISRPATFTFVFLIANIFVYVLMSLSGDADNPATLIAYGAKRNDLIDQGQWWRIITPIFLHGGIPHLLMNMYGLWILGPYVERLYGSAKFVVFWILTGIAGVVASYLAVRPELAESAVGRAFFKSVDVPSVGASGALFGLIGVLFVFGIKFRHELPEGFKRAFGTGMLPTILINIFIGYIFPFIDNAAHMGGLVAGAALALIVGYKRPHQRARVAVVWHAMQIAALVVVLISFAIVARNYSAPVPTLETGWSPNPLASGSASSFISFGKAVSEATSAFIRAVGRGDTGDIDAAMENLAGAPHLDDEADAVRDELQSLLARAKEYATAAPPQQRTERGGQRERQQLELLADFKSWQERFNTWFFSNSEKYGVRLQPTTTSSPSPPPSQEEK